MIPPWLYEKYNILEEDVGFEDIPYDIRSSLAKPLRVYQENAVKRFIYYFEKDKNKSSNHILFEMATGSGKTLTMATLILYLYKKGYRDFLFFVNSTTILEKTKINFTDSSSTKHLFQTIELNSQRVDIRAIKSLCESSPNTLNILFTTIQGLHSQRKAEKENALSLEDMKQNKLVLLADESHHLRASTKKGKGELSDDWEKSVGDLFRRNSQNILLEFTATAETSKKEIQDKYKDKLIYKYSLKEFCSDGFSKTIGMIVNRQENQERILLALMMNIFREDLLSHQKIPLKPVILFKSATIAASKENQAAFIQQIDHLKEEDIVKCFANAKLNEANTFVISSMLDFFQENDIMPSHIVVKIKSKFKQAYILNVNDEKDKGEHQILLNSLEDYNNRIRAIFAVNKLNEGWDVLNLFDIVKLYTTKSTSNRTQEAQLIGRGARYYPFSIHKNQAEDKYKRKYDKKNTPLRVLEMLHYHIRDENKFIEDLSKDIEKQGLLLELITQDIDIDVKKEWKEADCYQQGIIGSNKTISYNVLSMGNVLKLPPPEDMHVKYEIAKLFQETAFGRGAQETCFCYKKKSLQEIGFQLFYKAVSKNNFFRFSNIKIIGIQSIKELYTYYEQTIIIFVVADRNIDLSARDIIQGVLKFLWKLEQELLLQSMEGQLLMKK